MPDGWHFIQEGQFRIDAGSYKDLLDAVQNWRIQNSRPVGDVDGDVIDYICTKFPQQCQMTPAVVAQAVQIFRQVGQRFVDAIIEWAHRVRGNPIVQRIETDREAERRGGICLNCVHNKEWENSCPNCVTEANRLLVMIRRNKDLAPSLAKRMHGCKIQNHCNRTAVWLPKEVFIPSPELPPHCWLK